MQYIVDKLYHFIKRVTGRMALTRLSTLITNKPSTDVNRSFCNVCISTCPLIPAVSCRRRMNARIAELEDTAEQARVRAAKLDKEKNRLTIELRETSAELDAVRSLNSFLATMCSTRSCTYFPKLVPSSGVAAMSVYHSSPSPPIKRHLQFQFVCS